MVSEYSNSMKYIITVVQALFVTVLWSSSWVIIKYGLEDITPLIYSGLRYSIAAIILIAIVLARRETRQSVSSLKFSSLSKMILYGLMFVFITQGSMFIALAFLPAITVSMVLNMTVFIVLILSVPLLRDEIPSFFQISVIFTGLFGVLIYFSHNELPGGELLGLFFAFVCLLANALSSIMGRTLNRERTTPPIVITAISMLSGSIFLIVSGIIIEGLPVVLSTTTIIYILWLSIVNTAIAFTLWNKTMQSLRAVDSTLINSTMLPQIVILSIIYLGEVPDLWEWFGLLLLAASVTIVQISQARKVNEN